MTWEYSCYPMPDNLKYALAEFNRRGAQRWELVAVSGTLAYFKRPVVREQ
jgi:hypothetical protein